MRHFAFAIFTVLLGIGGSIGAQAQSVERRIVEEAKSQALHENKKLLVEVSAAWCGPCASLEKDLAENPDIVQSINSEYVWVHTEEEYFQYSASLTDFLQVSPIFYPSLYIYDPTQDSWTVLSASTASELKEHTDAFLVDGTLAKNTLADFETLVSDGASFHSDEAALDNLFNGLIVTPIENSQRAIEYYTRISTVSSSQPELFFAPGEELENSLFGFYLSVGASILMERGVFTVDEFRLLFPTYFKNDFDTDFTKINNLLYFPNLQKTLQAQGHGSAAQECQSLVTQLEQDYKPEDDGSPESETLLAEWNYYNNNRKISCMALRAGASLVSQEEIRELIEEIENASPEVFTKSLTHLAALGGLFDEALVLLEARKVTEETAYSENIESIQETIVELEAEGSDPEEIELYKEYLESLFIVKDRVLFALEELKMAYNSQISHPWGN